MTMIQMSEENNQFGETQKKSSYYSPN